MNNKITTKQIAVTAIMLALCILSQLFKNMTVYITGPIINTILIITTLYCGLLCSSIIAIITPITSFFITGAPVIAALPMIIPCIMIGNEILVLSIAFIKKAIIALKFKLPSNIAKRELYLLIPSMIIGSILKSLFMSIAIVRFIIPTFATSLPTPMIKIASVTFSTTQLITALIGGGIACVIWPAIKMYVKDIN